PISASVNGWADGIPEPVAAATGPHRRGAPASAPVPASTGPAGGVSRTALPAPRGEGARAPHQAAAAPAARAARGNAALAGARRRPAVLPPRRWWPRADGGGDHLGQLAQHRSGDGRAAGAGRVEGPRAGDARARRPGRPVLADPRGDAVGGGGAGRCRSHGAAGPRNGG